MIRTLILEALWAAVCNHSPAAPKSSLNLYFPKPSAAIHARSNTPLMLAGHDGLEPMLVAKKIQAQLAEEWEDQFSTAVTPRGALAFRLSDSYIWSHATEGVRRWLPEAINQAIASRGAAASSPLLPSELFQTLQLSITHLDGVLLLLASQKLPRTTNDDGLSDGWHLPPSPSNSLLTPLLGSLLLLPEHLAQEGTLPGQSFKVAIQHLLQQFNNYRSANPILGGERATQEAVAGSFALLLEGLRLVGDLELCS